MIIEKYVYVLEDDGENLLNIFKRYEDAIEYMENEYIKDGWEFENNTLPCKLKELKYVSMSRVDNCRNCPCHDYMTLYKEPLYTKGFQRDED